MLSLEIQKNILYIMCWYLDEFSVDRGEGRTCFRPLRKLRLLFLNAKSETGDFELKIANVLVNVSSFENCCA